MNWTTIFIAAFLVLLSGVTIGFVEGGLPVQSKEMALVTFWGARGAQFLLYTAVFLWVGYRQLHRPLAHAVAAVFVSFIVATAAMAAVSSFFSFPPAEHKPLLLVAIDWTVTAMALAVGLVCGRHLAKRRYAAPLSYDA